MLLEAAYHDNSESIRLEQQLKAFSEGVYKGGTGPSAVHRKEQHYSAQMKRADQYAAELLSHQSSLYSTTRQSAQADFEVHVDPHCSHKPTKRKSSSKQSKGKNAESVPTSKSDLEHLTSSSSDSASTKARDTNKRDARYRTGRSKVFLASLQRAKTWRKASRSSESNSWENWSTCIP